MTHDRGLTVICMAVSNLPVSNIHTIEGDVVCVMITYKYILL